MDIFGAYKKLLAIYGPQGWWPLLIKNGKSAEFKITYGVGFNKLKKYKNSFRDPHFEIAVGAILTQNTAWKNVAVAIGNLYRVHALTPQRILKMPSVKLQRLIRSAGYFRQKTKKLKIFSKWVLDNYQGDIRKLGQKNILKAREELLLVWGIGKETADSIILYALNKPIFVIDAYTKRFCSKYGIIYREYDEYRQFFESHLKREVEIFQEYHALLVASGKNKHQKI